MAYRRKVIYNRVMESNHDMCPLGELLTDKELKRLCTYGHCRAPRTAKVTVYNTDVYFSFGVRFAERYEMYPWSE
jgi:hypothetical protein